MNELPRTTQVPILHIDSTPNEDYPLRILKAYRQNCNSKWASTTTGLLDEKHPIIVEMNKHQDERAMTLDKAIEILERDERDGCIEQSRH